MFEFSFYSGFLCLVQVVHKPANYPLGATPPALVMLGGTGSRGNDTNMLKE